MNNFLALPTPKSSSAHPIVEQVSTENFDSKLKALELANRYSKEVRAQKRVVQNKLEIYSELGFISRFAGVASIVLCLIPAGAEIVSPSNPPVPAIQRVPKAGIIGSLTCLSVAGLCAIGRRRAIPEFQHKFEDVAKLKRIREQLREELDMNGTPPRVRHARDLGMP